MTKKICCEKEYGADQGFCGICGQPLEAVAPSSEVLENKGAAVPQVSQIPNKPHITGRKNKSVGMIAVGLVVVAILFALFMPKMSSPLVGKWNMELYGGIYVPEAYIEFKGNGTYTFGSILTSEEGKFKIVKSGNEGIVMMTPEDKTRSPYEANYKIEGDQLTFHDIIFKKEK